MDNKLRIEALQRLMTSPSERYKKVTDKYKDSNPDEELRKVYNEAYDITHKGMTQEEKEEAAEREYRAKRKEMGLE